MAGQCKSIDLAVGEHRVTARIEQVTSPICCVSEEATSAMVCSFGMMLSATTSSMAQLHECSGLGSYSHCAEPPRP